MSSLPGTHSTHLSDCSGIHYLSGHIWRSHALGDGRCEVPGRAGSAGVCVLGMLCFLDFCSVLWFCICLSTSPGSLLAWTYCSSRFSLWSPALPCSPLSLSSLLVQLCTPMIASYIKKCFCSFLSIVTSMTLAPDSDPV